MKSPRVRGGWAKISPPRAGQYPLANYVRNSREVLLTPCGKAVEKLKDDTNGAGSNEYCGVLQVCVVWSA